MREVGTGQQVGGLIFKISQVEHSLVITRATIYMVVQVGDCTGVTSR